LGLFGGLALLPLLLLAALMPPRGRERTRFGGATRTWSSTAAGAAGVAAACAAVAGPTGLAVAAVGLTAAATVPAWAGTHHRRPGLRTRVARGFASGRAWPLIASAGLMLSTGVLTTGPWLSGAPYQGHSAWAQVCALIGVAAAAVATVPASARVRSAARAWARRASHRTRARRAGSSTSA